MDGCSTSRCASRYRADSSRPFLISPSLTVAKASRIPASHVTGQPTVDSPLCRGTSHKIDKPQQLYRSGPRNRCPPSGLGAPPSTPGLYIGSARPGQRRPLPPALAKSQPLSGLYSPKPREAAYCDCTASRPGESSEKIKKMHVVSCTVCACGIITSMPAQGSGVAPRPGIPGATSPEGLLVQPNFPQPLWRMTGRCREALGAIFLPMRSQSYLAAATMSISFVTGIRAGGCIDGAEMIHPAHLSPQLLPPRGVVVRRLDARPLRPKRQRGEVYLPHKLIAKVPIR